MCVCTRLARRRGVTGRCVCMQRRPVASPPSRSTTCSLPRDTRDTCDERRLGTKPVSCYLVVSVSDMCSVQLLRNPSSVAVRMQSARQSRVSCARRRAETWGWRHSRCRCAPRAAIAIGPTRSTRSWQDALRHSVVNEVRMSGRACAAGSCLMRAWKCSLCPTPRKCMRTPAATPWALAFTGRVNAPSAYM